MACTKTIIRNYFGTLYGLMMVQVKKFGISKCKYLTLAVIANFCQFKHRDQYGEIKPRLYYSRFRYYDPEIPQPKPYPLIAV